MSGTSQGYNLSTNFRLPQNAPPLPQATPDVIDMADEIYLSLNNLVRGFVTLAGAGPRNFNEWTQLAGSASTILASNMNRLYVEASEDIAYGQVINLHNVAGNLRVRLANATNNTKPADGFCSTTAGIATGTVGEVILAHGVMPASGLTVGQRYYLAVVSGFMSNVPAAAAGNIEQYLGVAISTTELYLNTGYWIQH